MIRESSYWFVENADIILSVIRSKPSGSPFIKIQKNKFMARKSEYYPNIKVQSQAQNKKNERNKPGKEAGLLYSRYTTKMELQVVLCTQDQTVSDWSSKMFTGTLLTEAADRFPGHHSDRWNADEFDIFEGDVMLKQSL